MQQDEKQSRMRKRSLGVLCLVPIIMVFGNSMLIPAFPQMQHFLHISYFQTNLMITFFSIPAGVTIILLGFLSDRFGRKRIMVPALALYAIGGAISGFGALLGTHAFPIVMVGRVVQGIGAGGTAPIAMALASDIYQNEQRSTAQGVLEAANGGGKVLSPILGALAAMWAWFVPFFVYAVFAGMASALVALLVAEPKKKTRHQKESVSAERTFGDYFREVFRILTKNGRTLIPTFFAGMVVLFTLFGILSYLSDILESQAHLFGVIKGAVLAIPLVGMVTLSLLSGRYLQKHAQQMSLLMRLGLLMVLASLVVLIFVRSVTWTIGWLVLLGIGNGLTLPAVNTRVTSATETGRGAVTALYGSVRFFGVAFGPPIYDLLLHWGRGGMFTAAAVIVGMVTAAVFLLVHAPDSSQASGQQPAALPLPASNATHPTQDITHLGPQA